MRPRSISYTTKEGKRSKVLRETKLLDVEQILHRLTKQQKDVGKRRTRLSEVLDVARGVFEETEKLFKKSPVESITALMLQMVNEVIRDTKSLNPTDTQLSRITEFVAAGDNPEVRDVQLVINQLIKGQARFDSQLEIEANALHRAVNEAELITDCLQQFVHYDQELDKASAQNGKTFPEWFGLYGHFNFRKLEATDLKSHFSVVDA